MKADAFGTMTEQARARMGWKTDAQRKAAGETPDGKSCNSCDYSEIRLVMRRDESIGGSLRCAHPLAPGRGGMATRATAICKEFLRTPK